MAGAFPQAARCTRSRTPSSNPASIRSATSLERPLNATPFERAQYLAVAATVTEALQPSNCLELLLVLQLAAACAQHLRCQAVAVQRVEEDS